ncbi:MAG: antibiotic biosynthesis monooxygenase family protein [Candidatus Nanopelagicales bacterium]
MTVARINEFRAITGRGDELHTLLTGFTDAIRETPGCVSVQALRSLHDPDFTVIFEVWESVSAHEAAAQAIPADDVQAAVALLVSPPKGEYFTVT